VARGVTVEDSNEPRTCERLRNVARPQRLWREGFDPWDQASRRPKPR
jgi:hypothetical protein